VAFDYYLFGEPVDLTQNNVWIKIEVRIYMIF
jgi:hypothetical protein